MAKRPSFFFSPRPQNPSPNFLNSVRYFTMGIETQEQQQFTKIAGEICEIVRTQPRWENTLISHFPSFNFSDPRFFNEVLKLQNNAFLNLRLFNWLTSQSGFSPDPISCNSLFNNLLNAKASVLAKLLIDNVPQIRPDPCSLESLVCCLCEDGFVDEAVDLFAKLRSFSVFCPSVSTWNSALSGAVRVKRTDVVWKLYGEMIDSGVAADVETVGHLIEAFCVDNKLDRGYELLRDGGVAPSNVPLNRLIAELCKGGRYDRVSELMHMMMASNRNPDVYTYQGIIYGLCKRRKVFEGFRIFNDLKSRGYALDRVMYTTMIHGLCRISWIGEARKLWFEMISKGMIPNEYTYNVLIHGLCNIYAVDEAWKLLKEMCSKGYKLNTVNYNTLIGGLCKNGRVREACDLFEEMGKNGVVRDIITYNSLIRGVCKDSDLAKGRVLFEELLAQGLSPSTSSYTPLIKQLCQVGSTHQALELWTDMVKRGVEPSIYNRECIIGGLCKEGSPMEAMKWLSEMLERNLIPRQGTFEGLIQCLSEQDKLDAALLALNSMLQIGFILKKVVCGSLVSKLCSTGLNHVETHLTDLMSTSHVSEPCS